MMWVRYQAKNGVSAIELGASYAILAGCSGRLTTELPVSRWPKPGYAHCEAYTGVVWLNISGEKSIKERQNNYSTNG